MNPYNFTRPKMGQKGVFKAQKGGFRPIFWGYTGLKKPDLDFWRQPILLNTPYRHIIGTILLHAMKSTENYFAYILCKCQRKDP